MEIWALITVIMDHPLPPGLSPLASPASDPLPKALTEGARMRTLGEDYADVNLLQISV